MSQTKKRVVGLGLTAVVILMVAVVMASAASSSANAAQSPGQVVVVNPSNQPVPVAAMGTTTVTVAEPVTLAPGTSVSLAGTPTVNVANFPSSAAPTTVMILDEVLAQVGFVGAYGTIVDVSAFKEIRVAATSNQTGCRLHLYLVPDPADSSILGLPIQLGEEILEDTHQATRTYNLPGEFVRLVLSSDGGHCDVRTFVYGREN